MHDLSIIASKLTNQRLKDLARKLEQLSVSSQHLLYPDRWLFPKIPVDQYDEAKSTEAIELATQILTIVHDEIF